MNIKRIRVLSSVILAFGMFTSCQYAELHTVKVENMEQLQEYFRYKDGRPVGICGEMAGHPQAVIFLSGIGLASLSISASDIPEIKQLIRNASYEQAQKLATEMCRKSTADQVNASLYKTTKENKDFK